MEIKSASCSMVSNFEVMESLREIKDTKKKYGLRNLATITYEVLQYLEDTYCKNQTHESIAKFLIKVKPYKLTKNECLMIVNDPPTSALHMQLLVEDSEERLTEEQVQEILATVAEHFPSASAQS